MMLCELEPLLNEKDAAKVLRCATGTLANWRSKKVGPPFVMVGEAIRYSPEGLRKYIEARTVRTDQPAA